jgi:hypothetical protein
MSIEAGSPARGARCAQLRQLHLRAPLYDVVHLTTATHNCSEARHVSFINVHKSTSTSA